MVLPRRRHQMVSQRVAPGLRPPRPQEGHDLLAPCRPQLAKRRPTAALPTGPAARRPPPARGDRSATGCRLCPITAVRLPGHRPPLSPIDVQLHHARRWKTRSRSRSSSPWVRPSLRGLPGLFFDIFTTTAARRSHIQRKI